MLGVGGCLCSYVVSFLTDECYVWLRVWGVSVRYNSLNWPQNFIPCKGKAIIPFDALTLSGTCNPSGFGKSTKWPTTPHHTTYISIDIASLLYLCNPRHQFQYMIAIATMFQFPSHFFIFIFFSCFWLSILLAIITHFVFLLKKKKITSTTQDWKLPRKIYIILHESSCMHM